MGNGMTYIANAFAESDYVWVIIHEKTLEFKSIEFAFKNGTPEIDVKTDGNMVEIHQRIKRNSHAEIAIGNYIYKSYMTVLTFGLNDCLVNLVQNYPLKHSHYIITKTGEIRLGKGNKDKIWIDTFDSNHFDYIHQASSCCCNIL